jgi:hypothetical protein
MGPTVGPDAVEKSKIPYLHRESNSHSLAVQSVIGLHRETAILDFQKIWKVTLPTSLTDKIQLAQDSVQ